jgi:DNA-binding response OmpR family regulator
MCVVAHPALGVILSNSDVGLERGVMTTSAPRTTVLLIDNDPAAADLIRAVLAAASCASFDVECVRQLSDGLARLSNKGIAAVLLNLNLPDSQGCDTFDKVFAAAPEVPILILVGNDPEVLAKEALGRGAQDYLLPERLDYSLPRALRNAIERKAVADALYVEQERALVTLNSIGEAVLSTDTPGNITYLNLALSRTRTTEGF